MRRRGVLDHLTGTRGGTMKARVSSERALGDLRELLSDAETLVGAVSAGYSEEGLLALRERLKASRGRIAGEYNRLRASLVEGQPRSSDPDLTRACEVLALASGIGSLVGALADRHRP